MSDTTTVPGSTIILSGETIPFDIDMGLLIKAGQTPSLPTSALFDITTSDPGTSTPGGLSGSPTLVGNLVFQTVIGSGLTPGHNYRLILGCTAAVGTVWQAGVEIVCPF